MAVEVRVHSQTSPCVLRSKRAALEGFSLRDLIFYFYFYFPFLFSSVIIIATKLRTNLPITGTI
jgi:hypothetical protein